MSFTTSFIHPFGVGLTHLIFSKSFKGKDISKSLGVYCMASWHFHNWVFMMVRSGALSPTVELDKTKCYKFNWYWYRNIVYYHKHNASTNNVSIIPFEPGWCFIWIRFDPWGWTLVMQTRPSTIVGLSKFCGLPATTHVTTHVQNTLVMLSSIFFWTRWLPCWEVPLSKFSGASG